MLTSDLRDSQNIAFHEAPKHKEPGEGGSHPLFFLLSTVSSPEVFYQASSQLNPIMWNPDSGEEGWPLSRFMAAWPFICQDTKQWDSLHPKSSEETMAPHLRNLYSIKIITKHKYVLCTSTSSVNDICGGVPLVELWSVWVFTDDYSLCLRRDIPLD